MNRSASATSASATAITSVECRATTRSGGIAVRWWAGCLPCIMSSSSRGGLVADAHGALLDAGEGRLGEFAHHVVVVDADDRPRLPERVARRSDRLAARGGRGRRSTPSIRPASSAWRSTSAGAACESRHCLAGLCRPVKTSQG